MRTIKYARLSECEELIARYLNTESGQMYQIDESCLGLGIVILHNNHDMRLKNFVIEEYYLNEWSSGHRIKIYNEELPKKYLAMINEYNNKI